MSTIITLERVNLYQPYPTAFNEIEASNFNRLGIELKYDNIHQQRFGCSFSMAYQQDFGELRSDYVSRILEFDTNIFRPVSSRDNINSRFFLDWLKIAPSIVPTTI